MIYVVIIIFILFFVGAGGFLFYIKKKNENELKAMKSEGKILESSDISKDTTVSELPFESIKDSMIYLGDDQYRMVIECSSINLDLKTEEEQEVVEMSFQRFIQSLNFAFAFYIQTREIDNSIILENTRKDAIETCRRFPFMSEYANNYLYELSLLNENSGNSKLKKKYLIITFNDIKKMKNIEESDKWDIAFEELDTRCRSAIYGLRNVGIQAHVLNSNEIAEMIFRAYNKEGRSLIEGMTSGEMMSISVDSEKHATHLNKIEEMDIIINEFFRQLETTIINDSTSPAPFVEAAHQSIDIMNKMRDRVGGIYKQYPSSDRSGTYEEMLENLGLDEVLTKKRNTQPRTQTQASIDTQASTENQQQYRPEFQETNFDERVEESNDDIFEL